jgi:putative ABC transport system permease protein
MFKNYLLTAYRNFKRNKLYSGINVIGLALGLASALVIMLYVYDELTFDQFHKNSERIYRIASEFTFSGKTEKVVPSSTSMGPMLKQEFPEIKEFVRFRPTRHSSFISFENKQFYQDHILYADSAVFNVFSFTFIEGNPIYALTEKNSIVLTETLSKKIFGDENALNKVIRLNDKTTFTNTNEDVLYKVSGVVKDVPGNSTLNFSALLPFHNLSIDNLNQTFWSVSCHTYILANENSNIVNKINQRWPELYEKYMAEIGKIVNGDFKIITQPLLDIHFHSRLEWDTPRNGNIIYIYILLSVAVSLLVIASINYMNLATAKALGRAKEIGIRKVTGANKASVSWQFLSESFFYTILSFIFAITLVELTLPYFNELTQKSIKMNLWEHPVLIVLMFMLILFVGFMAGSYPAYYMSSYQPINILKGSFKNSNKGIWLRKTLVSVQFIITIIMLIATFIIYQQLNFVIQTDLGYNKDGVMVITPKSAKMIEKVVSFKEELRKNHSIISVSSASSAPGWDLPKNVILAEGENEMEEKAVLNMFVEHNYFDLMGMQIIEGRNFDTNNQTDSTLSIIINEAAAKAFGWDNPIVKKLQWPSNLAYPGKENEKINVIGVVKDFYMKSLHNAIEPMIIGLSDFNGGVIHIKLAKENIAENIEFIKNKWEEFDPEHPFEYTFLENNLLELYEKEKQLSKIFSSFSILCIIIACLGLFGLASFAAEQKSKEIGIRKVLGASIQQIIVLLSKEFAWLILLATLIACPIAWWAMDYWLQNFNLRVTISFWPFLISTMTTFIIAQCTIMYHAIKASRINPVLALRNE